MSNTTIDTVFDVVERHGRAMFAELRAVLTVDSAGNPGSHTAASGNGGHGTEKWTEVARLSGQTYSWPPENGGTEEYEPFIVYRAGSRTLALAQNVVPTWVKDRDRKQIWVFQVDEDGSRKRPISPFVATDDYDHTHDLIAIIRGNGPKGRAMFDPGTQLPSPYDQLRVEILGDRIAGHYNKSAIVAHEDDVNSMLQHGSAQIRMRDW